MQSVLFGCEQAELTSDDYYTPAWVFGRMGLAFDLDVCAPPGGGPFVPTARYLTMADDGLATDWQGRVWMNPPYSNVTPWIEKFKAHRNGVCLLPMAKSWWLHDIWESADGVTVSDQGGEMHFYRPGSRPLRIWFPVFFAAFGAECVEAIGRLGKVR